MGTETFDELRATLGRLGRVFHLERQADSVRRAIDDTLGAVRASMAGRRPVRVLYLLDTNPPFTAGPGTFIDELITAAGGRNVFGDVGVNWPTVSIEAVLQREPDVIVWPRPGALPDEAKALRQLPGWSELAAVRSGRVLVVDRDLFNRPGPHIGVAASTLADWFLRLDDLAPLSTGSGRTDAR
jgi:iron complex transport system substrate-binding protein